nr:molybdopterin molybdotransferase [Chloroflexota bacterium]
MLSVDEALERLLAGGLGMTEAETVLLADAVGRVPAVRRLVAAHDVPPFANSAMDGFAMLAADGDAPRRMLGESRAGGPRAPRVERGTAVRIMTGAPLPPGADAVVPLEKAREEENTVLV